MQKAAHEIVTGDASIPPRSSMSISAIHSPLSAALPLYGFGQLIRALPCHRVGESR